MRKYVILILVIISNVGFAQKEANIWYFGQNAGLDFNTGNPIALTDGQLITLEGCATISDSNGNLQFYTDGTTIWAKNHSIMNNGTGLNGNFSSTQSAIIIPKPESLNIYYVFTVDFQGEPNGLQYSEVDMTLNSGLGAVTATKNIQLVTPVLEKLTAVKHANGKDIWVLVHKNGSAEFYAYLVTSTGIQNSPIITNIGFSYGGSTFNENAGYMKVSPEGSKLAMAFPKFSNGVQLFDFDNSTGQLSNHRSFNEVPGAVQPYGLEFSPSGDLLYVSGSGGIGQFDTTQPTVFQMLLNYTFLSGNLANNAWGALQLAPDGKLYVTRVAINNAPEINSLSVINNPDMLGAGCDFQLDIIPLGTGIAKNGLPPFIQSFFVVGFQYENLCLGEITQFEANISQPYDTLSWDFGDGNVSSSENPTHTYSSVGDYDVTLSVTSGAQTSSETKTITIFEQPTAHEPQDILACDDDNDGLYSFDLTVQDLDILNGQSPSDFSVTYYASLTDYNNNNPITDPTNFTNSTAFLSQSIVASVKNIGNVNCEDITAFNIQVFESPIPSQDIPKLSFCDNISVGTDADGIIEFDLTQNEATILNGQPVSDFTVRYFTDVGLTNEILNPVAYSNTVSPQTIYVQVSNNFNTSCIDATSFVIEVLELPTVSPLVELKQCDDDLDGFSIFNLTEVYEELSADYQNKIIGFYETQTDAENSTNPILNEIDYSNQSVSTDVVWARVENSNGCLRTSQVNLIVSTTQIPTTYTRSFYKCDDGTDINDGIATFDLSSVNNEIKAMFPVGQQLIINYYKNQADALSEINPIVDITKYQNIGYPNTQDVFIRVDSALDNDCLGLGHHITLNVEKQPVAYPVVISEQCDDDGDGMYAFDTSMIETTILNGQTGMTVTYYDELGNSLPSPLPNPFLTESQNVRAVVINANSQDPSGSCSDETVISFKVESASVAYPINDIVACDDDNDDMVAFDTSNVENQVLSNQTGMMVIYYDENGAVLPSPLPNPLISKSQTITVRVENPLSNTCFDETTFNLVAIQQPVLDMKDIWLICEGGFVEIIAGENYDVYQWSTGETTSSIIVSDPGSYEVTAINEYDGVQCETTKTVTVKESSIASIIKIETQDWSGQNNNITVFAEGTGDYEFSLDGSDYQDSNEFKNLDVDDYTVYVRDKNGCGLITDDVYLIYYPHVFTPNDDGYNDTWQLYNSDKEPLNKIYIYNRYGKLLKQLSPMDRGWDGTFNGQLMGVDDYWFVLERQNGKIYKGHFTLKI